MSTESKNFSKHRWLWRKDSRLSDVFEGTSWLMLGFGAILAAIIAADILFTGGLGTTTAGAVSSMMTEFTLAFGLRGLAFAFRQAEYAKQKHRQA